MGRPRRIHQQEVFALDLCPHGHVGLTCGPVSLQLSVAAVRELQRFLDAGMRKLELVQGSGEGRNRLRDYFDDEPPQ